ncbi:pilus assembly protein [Bradyrhizobium sp. SZCCHNR1039]|uniref:TadE/TadG family type IV pilus assembly protein n=1 Tax=Bradyrhizobium sp. SZCCHNR1039 TaxID=3057350 RepID=UPI0029170D82|nr:pilus assembly protein [Bradyrhizobium sp. SZCCHNR1039]
MAPIRKSQTRFRLRGAVAIEYGFVLPVLLLFTFGIIDIGRLLWTFTTLSRATEAAARCAAVNSTACANTGLIQNYAVGEAWGLDVTAAAFTVTQPACGKQVSATYTFQFVIPWFYGTSTLGGANTTTLSATACYPPQYP